MSTKTLTTALSFATFLAAVPAIAQDVNAPRGREIRAHAGYCEIGPFGQTGKAGEYYAHCASLTDAEKCLAVIKQSFNPHNGVAHPARQPEKAAYCIDLLRAELLGNQ